MKNRVQQRTSIVWLSIFFYFIVSFLGFNTSVLCFEVDGCIIVEPYFSCYNDGFASNVTSQATSFIPSMKGDHSLSTQCISCVDVPLLSDFFSQSVSNVKNSLSVIKTPVITTFPLVLSSFARMAANGHSLQPLIDNHSFLASIRSVILLI